MTSIVFTQSGNTPPTMSLLSAGVATRSSTRVWGFLSLGEWARRQFEIAGNGSFERPFAPIAIESLRATILWSGPAKVPAHTTEPSSTRYQNFHDGWYAVWRSKGNEDRLGNDRGASVLVADCDGAVVPDSIESLAGSKLPLHSLLQ